MKIISRQSLISITMVLLLLFAAPQAFAIGLGDAEVRSYLNQPLLVRIQLLSSSGEELGSVTAGLASADDFEMMGLRQGISVPLHFDVHADSGNAYIDVSSRLAITDPVVQLVLEVRWSGGRMLREYTMFLDPPTFASQAPQPRVSVGPIVPATDPVGPPATEDYPDPELLDVVETIKPETAATASIEIETTAETTPPGKELPAQSTVEPVILPETPVISDSEPAEDPAEELADRQTATVPDDPQFQLEVSPAVPDDELLDQADAASKESDAVSKESDVAGQQLGPVIEEQHESIVEIAEKPFSPAIEPSLPDSPVIDEMEYQAGSEIVGPVQRGATLWAIASNFNKGTNFSINQRMLAIQRINPDAFGGGNINFLKQGAILKMPNFNETARLSKRQAMLAAIKQEQAYLAMRAGVPYEELPVISDPATELLANNDLERPVHNSDSPDSDEGRLQLIPPAQSSDEISTGSGAGGVGVVSTADVQEVLARTEEELANAQQENTYLNERILELEAQISSQQADGSITDSDMADMEASLREKRLSEAAEKESLPEASLPEAKDDEKPWFYSNAWWVGGLLLLLVAVVVWILRKLGGKGEKSPESDAQPSDEPDAQPSDEPDAQPNNEPEADNVISLESFSASDPETEIEPENESRQPTGFKKAKVIPIDSEQAVELDPADPEVKLDLARAYISMGDEDAAREILKEVLDTGDDAQIREAKEMMEEL